MATIPKVRYGRGRPSNFQRSVAGFLLDVALDMQNFLFTNNRVASGKAINSFEVDVQALRNGRSQLADLSAVGYIKFALGGRGEGGMPPVDEIQKWLDIKGLTNLDAWAVAKTIEALGTNDPHYTPDDLEIAIGISYEKWGERMAISLADDAINQMVNSFLKHGYTEI